MCIIGLRYLLSLDLLAETSACPLTVRVTDTRDRGGGRTETNIEDNWGFLRCGLSHLHPILSVAIYPISSFLLYSDLINCMIWVSPFGLWTCLFLDFWDSLACTFILGLLLGGHHCIKVVSHDNQRKQKSKKIELYSISSSHARRKKNSTQKLYSLMDWKTKIGK